MMDPDTINEIVLEDRQQQKEERELKNRILNMTNTKRKQELWQRYFPTVHYKTDLIF